MSDTLAAVVPIRLELTARYGDTQAMNGIHALLTSVTRLTADEVAAPVTEIVACTGCLNWARTATAQVTRDGHGIPVARVDADGTVVLIGQDPDGPGALIQVTTRDPAEAAGLVITVDGHVMGRSPIRPAEPRRPGRASRRPVTDHAGQAHGNPGGEGVSP